MRLPLLIGSCLVLTATAASAASPAVPPFDSWRPPKAHGAREAGAIAIDGGGDGRWTSPAVELDGDRRYAFVFSAKGSASGTLTSGPGRVNVDVAAPSSSAGRIAHTNVFRSFSAPGRYSESFHLGEWKMTGRAVFDAAELLPVSPRWKKCAGGIELGNGEWIDGNDYGFDMVLSSVARNDSRVLAVNRSGFNTDRWCLGGGDEVVYRHAVAGRRLLSARLSATCGHYARGTAAVEVSADGKSWTPVFTFSGSSSFTTNAPASLFPADAVWVRFRGAADCSLQIPSYSFDAKIDGAPTMAFGGVDYVANGTGAVVASIKAPTFYDDESYGELLPAGTGSVALWTASSGWKIPRTRALPKAKAGCVRVSAAVNEAEAVQLVVRPSRRCGNVRVSALDFVHATTGRRLAASCVDVLRVGYVRIEKPTDATGCRGYWPDPLLPQDGDFSVSEGLNQPFWVRVKPPKGTQPGVYRGSLVVEALPAGAKAAECVAVPFELEVFGFALPDRMTVETAFGFDANTAYRYHRATRQEDKAAICAKYMQALADHHMSPYDPAPGKSVRVSWKGMENPLTAEPVFDWAEWDAAMEEAFGKYHFTGFRFHVDGLGWGDCDGHGVPSFHGFKGGTPEYEALMSKYLGGLERHLREKGWLDKGYVYWYDEPEPRDYPFVMNGFKTLKKYAPGLRRMLTEEAVPALLGGPNTWCPLTPNLHSEGEAAARKMGDVFWWYVCCGPRAPYVTEFIDHPGVEMRLWLWQTWGEKVGGVLIWTTNWWTSRSAYPDPANPQNPYEDAMSWSHSSRYVKGTRIGWGNGDGRFFYPPVAVYDAKRTGAVLDDPVVTFRMELLRDGIEDYEYFAMLRRALDKAKSLPAEKRAECEALLAVPKDVYRSMTDFTSDPAVLERHRVKLARAIESIR